jgi:flavodoxin
MKSLIVYYSYSGNTEKVADILKEELSKDGSVDIVRLYPTDESRNFFVQAFRAFKKKRAVLPEAPFDVARYDLICIGTPVWAFAPAPAVNTYIEGLKNIRGKDAICFMTYGSGLGAQKCLDLMKGLLKTKGAFKIFGFGVQQNNVFDKESVKKIINEIYPYQ